MALTWATAAWFLPFVTPIAIWVAWSDMATMKIPNKAVLAMLIVFVVIGLLALPLDEYLWRYAHFGVVLVIGFLLNMVRAIGAGDAKFAAAMAPFIERGDAFLFMIILAATTFAAFVVHRVVRATSLKERFSEWESWTRKEFPMGFALAPSLVLYLLMPFLFGG